MMSWHITKKTFLYAVILITAFALKGQSTLAFRDLNIKIPTGFNLDTTLFYSFKGDLYFLVKHNNGRSVKMGIYNSNYVWYTNTFNTNKNAAFYDMDVNPNGVFLACQLDSLNFWPAVPSTKICLITYQHQSDSWIKTLELNPSNYALNQTRIRYFKNSLYINIDTTILRQTFGPTPKLVTEARVAGLYSGFPMLATSSRLFINGEFNKLNRPVIVAPSGSSGKLRDTLRLKNGIFHMAKSGSDNILKLGSDGNYHYTLEMLDSNFDVFSPYSSFNDSTFSYSDSGYMKSRVYYFKNNPAVISYLSGTPIIIYFDHTTDKWRKLKIDGKLIRAVGSEGNIYGYNRLTGGFSEIINQTFISGNVFFDRDNDCIFNLATEPGIGKKLITFSNTFDTFYTLTDSNGFYRVNLPHGTYQFSVKASKYLRYNCGNDTIQFYYNNQRTKNIAASTFNGPESDVYFEPRSQMRLGDTLDLIIYVTNETTASLSRNLQCKLPSKVKYIGPHSNPAVVQGTLSGDTVKWNTGNIKFGEKIACGMRLRVDPALASINDILTFSARLIPDSNDYRDTLKSLVVAAYDPNIKNANPFGIAPLTTKKISYRIHFQNLGNSYAENVTVTDTISSLFHFSRILIKGASHPYSVSSDGRMIIFNFRSIYLQPAESNVELSKGWIDMEIDLIPGLQEGTVIDNKAYIYFDYNPPIITNTSRVILSKYASVTSSGKSIKARRSITLFPNPGSEKLKIKNTSLSLQPISIYDLSGKLLVQTTIDPYGTKEIDCGKWESGIYFVHNNGETQKWVKIN